MSLDPLSLIKPGRKIVGMSAMLLPFTPAGEIDWKSFRGHLLRTHAAGLTPAVNMDTGYVNLLDDSTRRAVLEQTYEVLSGAPFVAGAFIADQPGAGLDVDGYRRQIARIEQYGGLPIVFQSFGLSSLNNDELINAYRAIARDCQRFLAFELGAMFAPFGRIYDLKTYGELLAIPQCVGAKHSSLSRAAEWDRLALRNERRPEFLVLTGNDLAIDMVMYGSDYLLGLSTFAPDFFQRRDALWLSRDPAFFELNDLLQYLGFFAFRAPTPAYKHSASQFLRLRGWIECDATHPGSESRPESDRLVLEDIRLRLEAWTRTVP